MRLAVLLVLAAALAHPARAQEAPPDTLGDVLVEAAPFALAPARAPLALTVRTRTAAEVATDPAVGLGAVLAGLPGVWVSDRGSYAQGERLLVRGLGWRAAFGVRGTHVLLDGVPLTLADGQTQLNVVDPALVRRAEVVRGPASTFWGSGAGGVVALSTDAGPGAPRLQARALGGSYGLASASVAVRPALGAGRRLAAWGSYLGESGYRDHGAVRQARAGVSGGADLGAGREVSVVGLLAVVPRAESPGGITAEAFREDPRQTRPVTVEQDAGKELVQGHAAVSYAQPLGSVRLRATATGGARTLDNPIVPRYIQLDRTTAGLRVTAEGGASEGGAAFAWGLGLEGELQRDDRLETSNADGEPGPDVLTDQVETVRSGAVFGRLSTPLGPLTATAALRADLLGYRADVAGDERGAETRTLGAVSPSVGLAAPWRAGGVAGTAYANVAGALDAPTTTELGNRPGGAAGFNPDLRPERTWGAEAGARATAPVGGGAVALDVAVFAAAVRDLLVPFDVDDVTFYRNEGRTRHVGVEVGVQPLGLPLGPGRLDGAASYAWTRARFTQSAGGLAVDGNAVPGVPEHLATGTLTWTAPPVVLGVGAEAASGYVADSANEQAVDGYVVVHLRAALAGLRVGRGATVSPFVAVRNVGGARYAGSVVVNAFGGRYVEPGAGRHVQAGVSVALD